MNIFDGRAPQHLGFLVPDVLALSDLLATTLGCRVAAPVVLDIDEGAIEVGTPGAVRILLAQLGPTLLEFIEPLGTAATVWRASLDVRGPGLHHVAFTQIPHYADVVADLQVQGYDLSVAGHFGDDRWCYLERDGLVLELASGIGPQFPEQHLGGRA